ncbi:J domain-containing protein [Pararhodobacter oceanensis]|uniref:Molecular chaperone DnaJ n=1 Tax=Pararhodobacter oceanensis TaxID=2172121 RepID=A0A2T8HRC0_9RHOB|nr:J domain-containing protein [Pararhodobacter oceanensis]PVH27987.1 molecular chaperone DnaJ [Pararhodobacter oceanensis]
MSRDPFNFDMRASTDKKKKTRGRRGMSGAVETSHQQCHHAGCTEPGQYRAPRARDQLDDYLWFCKEHIREYNLKWNFFEGQTEAEMQGTMEHDRVWGRATQPFGSAAREAKGWARHGINDPHQVLGDKATQSKPEQTRQGGRATRKLPSVERKALEILDARDNWSRAEIRKQYKSLVKDLHPDRNAGNRADEERLQEVVWAWDQIKESRSFRD